MRELPRVNVSEDFYMWFDLEEKKEHYATPLYLYQVKEIELILMMKQNYI